VQKFLKKQDQPLFYVYSTYIQPLFYVYSTYYSSVIKISVVKQFNRTLKTCGNTMEITNGSIHPVASCHQSNYNARKYRTIGMRSVNVIPAITDRLLTTIYNRIKIATPAQYKVNDSVNRVSKFKTVLYIL